MDLLTEDAVALIRALKLEKVHFCGLSMGGFIGMRLAARLPIVGAKPHFVRDLRRRRTSRKHTQIQAP